MKILKPNEVVEKTGLSRVTLWRLETSGNFPKRVNLTDARVGGERMILNRGLILGHVEYVIER